MSRTYRAKKGDRWWVNTRYHDESGSWKWRKDTIVKYWESDNAYRWGGARPNVKWHCDTLRRVDERIGLHKAMKDEEFDFIDREKAYKGIWWYYD